MEPHGPGAGGGVGGLGAGGGTGGAGGGPGVEEQLLPGHSVIPPGHWLPTQTLQTLVLCFIQGPDVLP